MSGFSVECQKGPLNFARLSGKEGMEEFLELGLIERFLPISIPSASDVTLFMAVEIIKSQFEIRQLSVPLATGLRSSL